MSVQTLTQCPIQKSLHHDDQTEKQRGVIHTTFPRGLFLEGCPVKMNLTGCGVFP